ncbi:MAG: rhodanese-like domain-containing protein [Methylococcaceae bacterium]
MKLKLTLFLILSFFTTFIYAEKLGNLSPAQLISMQKNNNALVIDVRTEKEWNTTGTIPNSHKLQFFSAEGKFNAQQWLADLNNLKTSANQPIILVCRSGNRSGMVGKMLTEKQGLKNIYHLSSGIMPWIKAGNKIEKDCPTKVACN